MARSKRAKQSLSAGLARSANKRGLTGEARERYIIGGAINAEKKHEARLKHLATARTANKKKPVAKNANGRERLVLTTKVNEAASEARGYEVYSIYKPNEKHPYTSGIYRKRSQAQSVAKTEMEKHNHPKGVHAQNSLL